MTAGASELAHLFRALKAPAAASALPKLAERAVRRNGARTLCRGGAFDRGRSAREPWRREADQGRPLPSQQDTRGVRLHLPTLGQEARWWSIWASSTSCTARRTWCCWGRPVPAKRIWRSRIGIRACLAGQRVAVRHRDRMGGRLGEAKRQRQARSRAQATGTHAADRGRRGRLHPFDPEAANLMFSLVSRRYERASMIVTSNKPFSAWGEIFGDEVVAAR